MKTVLYVTNIPSPYRVAFLGLLAESVELTVIYERRTADNREKRWLGETGTHRCREIFLDGKGFGKEFSLSLGLVRHLKHNRYDVVIFGGYNSPTVILAMGWMRRHRLPYGITVDGMLPKAGRVSPWKERLKRWLISHGDFFLSSGHITTGELVRYGARRDRIYETPFSSVHEAELPAAPPDREACKAALGCEGKTVLLYVGQFIPRKGLDVLLPAFRQFCLQAPRTDALLYLAGGTEEQLAGLGLTPPAENVRCVGFLSKQELQRYYRAADLFVLPTREDIWGLVVNEAMANGTPVLTTTRCVAGLELCEPGKTGVLVPPEDAEALAAGIRVGLALTDRAAILRQAGRYTLETMKQATCRAIELAAAGPADPNHPTEEDAT